MARLQSLALAALFLSTPLFTDVRADALAQGSSSLTNLGLAGFSGKISGNRVVFSVSEADQGQDLNGDSDSEDSVAHVHDLEAGTTTNLGLVTSPLEVSGNRLVFSVLEAAQGEDLNDDGDSQDLIIHVHDLEAGTTTNLGLSGQALAVTGRWLVFYGGGRDRERSDILQVYDLESGTTANLGIAAGRPVVSGKWLVFTVREADRGEDLNGDDDVTDFVVHTHDLEEGTTTNLEVASYAVLYQTISDYRIVFTVKEADQGGLDLNGDGDSEDFVVHVHDLEGGTTTNFALSAHIRDLPVISGKWLVFRTSEAFQGGQDLNGDGDAKDLVLHACDLEAGTTTNLGFVSEERAFLGITGSRLVFSIREGRHDLNGDGDLGASVFFVHDLAVGTTTNLTLAGRGLAVSGNWLVYNGVGGLNVHDLEGGRTTNLGLARSGFASVSGDWLVCSGYELDQDGQDLNGDGDAMDQVLHVGDLSSLDGGTPDDPAVPAFVDNLENLGVATRVSSAIGNRLLIRVIEFNQGGQDLNGDNDSEDEVWHVHHLETGTTANLGIAAGAIVASSNEWVVFSVWESAQGRDLNGDGDSVDYVFHLHDIKKSTTTALALASGTPQVISDRWLVFDVSELQQNTDLNGDGFVWSDVLHVYDLEGGTTTNLGVSAIDISSDSNWIVFSVLEDGDQDLNGDGDLGQDLDGDGVVDELDRVLHLHDLDRKMTTNLGLSGDVLSVAGNWLLIRVSEAQQGARDLNGDGDSRDDVLHVHDLEAGTTANLGLAGVGHPGWIVGNRIVLTVSEQKQGAQDLNGDGDSIDDVLHVHNLETGITTNLGLAGFDLSVSSNWLVFSVREIKQGGRDLNGDGDPSDLVLHVHDLEAGTTTNLGLPILNTFPFVSGRWLAFDVSEGEHGGQDLNGDGDSTDNVLHVHDLEGGTTTTLGLARHGFATFSNNWLVFSALEVDQGDRDLNGDGDSNDLVLFLRDLQNGTMENLGAQAGGGLHVGDRRLLFGASEAGRGMDLNGDGDSLDTVLHLHDFEEGTTINLGVPEAHLVLDDWLVYLLPERAYGQDFNHDGDAIDFVLHAGHLDSLIEESPTFLRADCNDDGGVDISDAVSTLGSLFLGEGDPGCDDACDSNDDGGVDISDAIATLGVLFLGNGTIPLPGLNECGVDPTADKMGCDTFERCP